MGEPVDETERINCHHNYTVKEQHYGKTVWLTPQGCRRFTADDLEDRMGGIVHRPGEAFVDEIPDAYKDIDVVMADAETLVKVVHRLRQVMNVKGT